MKKFHWQTTLGIGVIVYGLVLLFSGYTLLPFILILLGSLIPLYEQKKFSSNYQSVTIFLGIVVLGLALDYPPYHIPFYLLGLVCTASVLMFRMIFFSKYISQTNLLWFEPVMVGASTLFLIAANWTHPQGWMGYVFPSVPYALSVILTAEGYKEAVELLKITSKGYLVQRGKQAPDFMLPDQTGKMVKLSDFKNNRNILLVFVRGDWCPSCHIMLRTYQKESKKFQEKNIHLLAVCPDIVSVNNQMVDKLGLSYQILADSRQKTARQYGCQVSPEDLNRKIKAEKLPYAEGVPLPASFLIGKDGNVLYTSRPDRVGEFLNPSSIFPALESVN